MCGIVGIAGPKPCADQILDSLKRLEYRGYDSAGIATLHAGEFSIVRSAGKLANLDRMVRESPLPGTVGIGHTRWATHGRPSEQNAHPHRYQDCVVVHNGIIENFNALKKELAGQGHTFSSETDSEIIAHLVHREYTRCRDFSEAVRGALARLSGSFAVAVLHKEHPDTIVAARRMSPLVVGLGAGENYVASDAPALLSCTRDFVFLDDGEMAVVTSAQVSLSKIADGAPVQRAAKHVSWSPAMAEKGGYKHFMLKEIHEQPRAVSDTVRPRLGLSEGAILLEELEPLAERLSKVERVCVIACGTSFHAGMVGKWFIESMARVPCDVEVASEFRYRDPLLGPGHLVVAVSQSGETADTLAAAQEAKKKGAAVVTICNVVDSSLPRMADAAIYTYAGPEIGVASTKAFTCQMAVFYLLALYLAQGRGKLTAGEVRKLMEEFAELPSRMETVLAGGPHVLEVAKKYVRASSMLYLGRGLSFPIALEGALKAKELSYIHAEGYPAGEMKHGPIALVDDAVPNVFVIPPGVTYEKTLSNIQEIRSRNGRVVVVTSPGQKGALDVADDAFLVPDSSPALQPFLSVLPLQLFAYHLADQKGTDVDQPRNLAKSVTVE